MKKLHIATSPHMRDSISTQKVMLLVIAALLPSAVAAVVHFGWRALLLMVFCVVVSVACEGVCRQIMKREQTIKDGSAALTGLLLAMNLPVTLPLWEAALGCFIAIVIVKQLFGGLGQNFANPAITARVVLMVSLAPDMTHWILPKTAAGNAFSYDAVSSATPLVSGNASIQDLFWGSTGGCLGETCAAAILFGGLFLVFMGIISPVTPLAYLGTVAVATFIATGSVNEMFYQLMAGGLLLGAFFMATDYVTTPITAKGKLIFGIGCGLLTFLIRFYGSFPEGVSLAILLMNILTPYIDKFTMTHPFGAVSKKKEAK
ncbi:MAG: RnfABCDGE type electron transport complex subunit D [Oscillospiraceae bacterium]|nr:RnfABCDGE type electron transport complex subunit D [Oscillospiraceae bacterium]